MPSRCLLYSGGIVESVAFDRAFIGFGGAVVATESVVRRSFVPVGRRTTLTSAGVEVAGSAPCAEVLLRPRDPPPSHVVTIQHLI